MALTFEKLSTFKPGDKVVLTTTRHGNSKCNPVWGGQHGKLVGIIEEPNGPYRSSDFPISVLWENGEHNQYTEGDLCMRSRGQSNGDAGLKVKFKNKIGKVVCSIRDHYIVNFKEDVKGFSCDGKYKKGSCLVVKRSETEKIKEKKKDKGEK